MLTYHIERNNKICVFLQRSSTKTFFQPTHSKMHKFVVMIRYQDIIVLKILLKVKLFYYLIEKLNVPANFVMFSQNSNKKIYNGVKTKLIKSMNHSLINTNTITETYP